MSCSPYRLVSKLTVAPELAVLSVLNSALEQAACALLAQHQDIGQTDDERAVTSAARAVIDSAWRLKILVRRYRAALAHERRCRDIPF